MLICGRFDRAQPGLGGNSCTGRHETSFETVSGDVLREKSLGVIRCLPDARRSANGARLRRWADVCIPTCQLRNVVIADRFVCTPYNALERTEQVEYPVLRILAIAAR